MLEYASYLTGAECWPLKAELWKKLLNLIYLNCKNSRKGYDHYQ